MDLSKRKYKHVFFKGKTLLCKYCYSKDIAILYKILCFGKKYGTRLREMKIKCCSCGGEYSIKYSKLLERYLIRATPVISKSYKVKHILPFVRDLVMYRSKKNKKAIDRSMINNLLEAISNLMDYFKYRSMVVGRFVIVRSKQRTLVISKNKYKRYLSYCKRNNINFPSLYNQINN